MILSEEQKTLIRTVLDELARNKMEVITSHPEGGCMNLTNEDVVACLENRTAFYAKMLGLTVENYLKWKEFEEDPVCFRLTKKGTRCQNEIFKWRIRSLRERFFLGQVFCGLHENEASFQ